MIYICELPESVQHILASIAYCDVLAVYDDADNVETLAKADEAYQNVREEKIANVIDELQRIIEDEVDWRLQYVSEDTWYKYLNE